MKPYVGIESTCKRILKVPLRMCYVQGEYVRILRLRVNLLYIQLYEALRPTYVYDWSTDRRPIRNRTYALSQRVNAYHTYRYACKATTGYNGYVFFLRMRTLTYVQSTYVRTSSCMRTLETYIRTYTYDWCTDRRPIRNRTYALSQRVNASLRYRYACATYRVSTYEYCA